MKRNKVSVIHIGKVLEKVSLADLASVGEVSVFLVILRPVYWYEAPFGNSKRSLQEPGQ